MIGFIGLGNMGSGMARSLMRNGKKLIILDTNKAVVDEFKAEGCEVAEHPSDIAAASRHIITMLPRTAHVNEVYTGSSGILKTIQRGTLCIDCSTIDRHMSTTLAKLVREHNAEFMDAPVSGGIEHAKEGTLKIMVGAESEQVFERAKEEVLSKMAKKVYHVGKVGDGQAVKVCNMMVAGINALALSEAMNLGIEMGIDPVVLNKSINTSTGYSYISKSANPVPGVHPKAPASNEYKDGFTVSLMARDLSHAQIASTDCHAATPLGSLTHQIYTILAQNPEYSSKDFTSIYQFLINKKK
ncbi:unnamed protein product [Caenorhabditis angaria]|uniref:3-hydroxyisobutyrate dehydrogenase n=1 Tax=Caenorhabditis angaria TaxID=860376 RepID=A0A9P1IUZ9_9PELO|nr:unnamed protein product [Caenorhabditis angaria]